MFEGFIALQCLKRIYGKAHYPDLLRNEIYGPKIFQETVPLKNVQDVLSNILCFPLFDNESTC